MQQWVNLDQFGIEMKKVQTPNGKAFPVMIIQDVEKYKNSGAIPLSQLNDPDNATKFIKLPGERKGRNSNTPMYLLTKSFKNGVENYDIKASLAKLLNTTEADVKKYYEEQNESSFVVINGYADFEKFNQVIDQGVQRFYGSTLYVVKEKKAPENLIDLSKKLIEQQHNLFPKSTVANIPFQTLDAFGLNSSIIDKAFLNPDDALKHGYILNDLTAVRLQGDRAVLPISINKDNSLNIILDPININALAYAGYSWQKNFPLVEDYNALVSVREASRNLLNARPVDIKNAPDMEKHIENMSLVLQNFNASQTAIKLHKPLKLNANGVYTYLYKNKDNEWRFIEKEGFTKKDEPLNWNNYKKAVEKIAAHNNVVSGALELRTLQGEQLGTAIEKVFKNQEKLFKKYVKVIDGPTNNVDANVVVINEVGSKVNAAEFDSTRRKFDRDVGQSLESQQILSTINALNAVPDAGNIRNTMGQHVDAFSLEQTVTINPGSQNTADILDIYEKSLTGGRPPQNTEDVLRSANTNLDLDRKAVEASILTVDVNNTHDYNNLPQNMSAKITQNYPEINDIFKAMQRLNLSDIPFWKKSLQEANELKAQIYEAVGHDVDKTLREQVKSGLAPVEVVIPEEQKIALENAEKSIHDISAHLVKEQLKANILQYQFAKFTQDLDQSTYGGWVFDRDELGNLKPFGSKSEYESALKLVENGFSKANAENGSLIPDKGPVRLKIDTYVENAYQIQSNDVNKIFENIDLLNSAARSKLQFVDIEVDTISVSHLSNELRTGLFNNVVNSLNQGLVGFNQSQNDIHLDKTLLGVSKLLKSIENQSGLAVALGNPQLSHLLANYGDWDAENQTKIYDSVTGIPLSSRAKIDAIKGLAAVSFAHLKGVEGSTPDLKNRQIEIGEVLAKSYTQNELKISNIDVGQYQYGLAGSFSIINQHPPTPLTGIPLSDQRFGLSLTGSDNSYKLIKFDAKNAPDFVNKVLDASHFPEAKKEAFMLYQMHAIAAQVGITHNDLNQIAEIAKSIREGDEQKVKEYSGKLLGIEFSTDDLLDMKYSMSQDVNRINNKDYVIETPDTGTLKFDPIQGADVVNQISLIHKLTGTESNFEINPLLNQIDSSEKYDAIQKYINISSNEHHEINAISLSYPITGPEVAALSTVLTTQALTSFNSLNKNNPDLGLASDSLQMITTIPQNNSDVVMARIIPNSWLSELSLENRNQLGLNISPVTDIDQSTGKLNSATVKALVGQHITEGDGVSNIGSKPILLDAVLNNPIQKAKLTQEQNQILKEGNLNFIREPFFSRKESLDLQVATSNLEVALSNLPNDLRSGLISQMKSPDNLEFNQGLRFSMGPQKGTEIPELRLGSVHDCLPHDHTIIQDVSTQQLAKILNTAEVSFDQNNERFNIPKFSAQKLGGVIELHKQALDIVKFDFNEYQNNVISKYNATTAEPHADFVNKFPIKDLTIKDVESVYADILIQGLDQLRKEGHTQEEAYLSFGKEKYLPQLFLSSQQTVDSFTVNANIDNVDVAKSIVASTSLFVAQMPKDAIIDHLQPIALSNAEIGENSLLVVRQNFIEQFKKLGDMSATADKISESIDHSKLYALNDGQNTTFALAASKSRMLDLAQKGCTAVINEITPDAPAVTKNLLGQMTTPDDQIKQNLVSFVSNLPASENLGLESNQAMLEPKAPRSLITAISPLAVFKDELEAKNNLIAQKDFDSSRYLIAEVKTEYAEPMANRYSPDQVTLMSGTEIQDKIQLGKMWPKLDLKQHIVSQHQNLDALILDRAIRGILPEAPEMREGVSLNAQASSYVFFINEVHKGLSSAKNINDVLDNFQKAVVKTNVFNPDFLASEDKFFTQKMEAFTKAAYQKNSQGVPLGEALTQSLGQSNVHRIYEKVINDLSNIEKLYSGEKSFINYLNGPELNAPADQVKYLSNALNERMIDNRNPPDGSLNSFEINQSNPLIPKHLSAQINGKSPVDYNSEDSLKNLHAVWGIETAIDPQQKMFEKGYVDVVNQGLEVLHSNLGGANSIEAKDLSLGGMTLELGSFNHHRDANYISIPTMQPDHVSAMIQSSWLVNLNAKIEAEEIKLMSSEHAAQYAEFTNEGKINGQNLGLISYAENYAYQPQSEGLKNLVETFKFLKNDFGTETPSPSHQLIEHAALIETQKNVAFTRMVASYDAEDDDMRKRTFFVENYASQFVKDMSSKQDEMFRKIESKMSSISNEAKGSSDLYDFETLSSMVDKVISIPLPSSKSAIEKYADSVKNSPVAKEHGYEKEDIVLGLTSNLEAKSLVFTSAQDVLASRAASKFIALMDQYAPAPVKESPEYVDELNKYFNLGESSELVEPNFKSKFGQHFEHEYAKNEIHSEYANNFTPEDMTIQFLNASISNHDSKQNIDEVEKNVGIDQVVKMVKSLPAEIKEYAEYAPTLDKKRTNTFENN